MSKIDHDLFIILYKDGLNYDELASAFNTTQNMMKTLKSRYKLVRSIPCMDCGELFTTGNACRMRCPDCQRLNREQFYLFRQIRYDMHNMFDVDPGKARSYLRESCFLEGELFCRHVLGDGLFNMITEEK